MSKTAPHISVAPMMDWTDRHCRYFLRLIAPNVRLYTEMVTTGAILHGDKERFLRFDSSEHPLALQLGGSDPQAMAACSQIGEEFGYDEINMNCGCPSDRVQNGRFGACLMKEPEIVAACAKEMIRAVDIPVTVKCRIGIDDQDDFAFLDKFVGSLWDVGVKTVIIHARKAWLQGLSPKENREVPPLDYGRVAAVKEKYPQMEVILNGGLQNIEQIKNQLEKLDGVMIGREAYQNPYFLIELEKHIFKASNLLSREDIARKMADYAALQHDTYGTPVKSITRHILGLYLGLPGAKAWRRTLSTLPYEDGAGPDVILQALDAQKNAAQTLSEAA